VISRKPLQEKGKINEVNLGTRFTTVIKPCTRCNQSTRKVRSMSDCSNSDFNKLNSKHALGIRVA